VPDKERVIARTSSDVVVREFAEIAIDYFVVTTSGHHVVSALACENSIVAGTAH
jgi:hypothetical protein